MKPPKTNCEKRKTKAFSIVPKIATGTNTKETLSFLIQVFMNINSAISNAVPGVVQEWRPCGSEREMTQTFIANADHVSRLFANFLKVNPLYKRLTMADRCSTFFRCSTRLNRIFKAAPVAMNQSNFNKLQTLFPDFHVRCDVNFFLKYDRVFFSDY